MPSITELRKVLTEQDWQWTPYFRITPLKPADVKKAIFTFYFAFDNMIEEWEHRHCKDEVSPKLKQESERLKQNCRYALMTYTQRTPFAVRHRRLIENWLIPGLWKKQYNLWYFAIAWQFQEWYDHIEEVYYDAQDRNLKDQAEKTLERLLETNVTAEQKGLYRHAFSSYILSKHSDMLQERLDFLDKDEQVWLHKEMLLDVWIDLRGFLLDVSEKQGVLLYTYNRLQ